MVFHVFVQFFLVHLNKMTSVGERLFWKKESSQATNSSDAWDDAELIKAYDKAIADLKTGNSESIVKDRQRKKKKKKETKATWKVGMKCLAVYSEDGLYYEATILSVNKGIVYVVFDYYENEEEVEFGNLLPIEEKFHMEVATDSIDYFSFVNGGGEEHQPLSEESQNQSVDESGHMNWHVSDICYVVNKNSKYEKAVLNAFKSSEVCRVTIIKSNKKKEVNISQLFSYIPVEENKRSKKYSSKHCSCSSNNCIPLSLIPPLQIPPPFPATLLSTPSRLPNQSFLNAFSPMNYTDRSYKKGGMNFNIPKCPPLPVVPEDVIAGNEEALANMLMSWYTSGYHTGYYQGMNNVESNSKGVRMRNSHQRGNKTLV